MHAEIAFSFLFFLVFFTIREERPGTKVNAAGHPGCVSCQQSLQLLTPQKVAQASINCQVKFREYPEFSRDKVKQSEVDNAF